MIIFAKADGTVIETKPTPFYQGSSLKGSIYLVAPFPNTNGVTIQFHLPNGNVTKAYPMTPTGEVEGVMLDGYELSAWTWDVKNAMVTAIPGMVTATITVYNGEPNITYYGEYPTFEAIDIIEKPQINAYAYCKADGKVYKYNGSTWTESDIAISANDYVKATIISSFPIIKGTPNALDVSTPSADEWQAIISALNAIGGKVAKPLMTNFEYDPKTGESVKSYNNGMIQTETLPSVIPDNILEFNSFIKTTFIADEWVVDNERYSLQLPVTYVKKDFTIDVYSNTNVSGQYEKMNPEIILDRSQENQFLVYITLYSSEPYSGYVLMSYEGTFVDKDILSELNTATANAERATLNAENATLEASTATTNANTAIANAETATAKAETIANTLETAYENGEFGIPSGGTAGQILTKTESGTAWEDAPSGGGNSSALLYMSSEASYGDYDLYFAFPKDLSDVDKILIRYTSQYSDTNYGPVYGNQDITIYQEGTFNSGMILYLMTNAHSDETLYAITTEWKTTQSDVVNLFVLPFYSSTEGSYGGKVTNILFEIIYK